jgi:hypothetical protein
MSVVQETTPILAEESFKYTPTEIKKSWSDLVTDMIIDTTSFETILDKTYESDHDIHALWLQAQNDPNTLPFEMEYLTPRQVRDLAPTKTSVELFQNLIKSSGLAGFRLVFKSSFENQNILIRLGRGVGYLEIHLQDYVKGRLNFEIQSAQDLMGNQSLLFLDFQCGLFSQIQVTENWGGGKSRIGLRVLNANVKNKGSFRHLLDIQTTQSPYLRNQITVHLDEEEASTQLLGAFNQSGASVVESETWVLHHQPKTVSEQLYKASLREESRNISLGHVFIEKGAIESNASQMIKALILSSKAKVDFKPLLDIHCDDVKAIHGAAISRFQDEELFYLASRGIKPESALKLLEFAFLTEVREMING